MGAIFKLAVRNLKEHKSKTIIISLFLIFGIAIVILGNSFLESINRGLERDFRDNYTGDITLSVIPPKGAMIDIFSATPATMTTSMDDMKIPAINELDKVMDIVNETKGITKKTKLISAQVLVLNEKNLDLTAFMKDDLEFDDIPIAMLFAGEDETYWDTFKGIKFIDGTYPTPGTNEIIVDTRVKAAYESLYKKELKVGDTISMSNPMGITIRDGVVAGIFKPANEYSAMFQCIYCDPSMARAFADLTYGSAITEELPEDIDLSIGEMSEEELFGFDENESDLLDSYDNLLGDDDLFGSDDDLFQSEDLDDDLFGSDDMFGIEDMTDISSTPVDFDDILGDTTLRDELNKTDDGAWQFVLMKNRNPLETDNIIEELNAKFKEQGLNTRAMGWKLAAASYAYSVEGIGFIFNLLIVILGVVVFIIIMNTMTVSIIERTGEIGTMRAIGAEKKFVKKLFYTETVTLTAFSSVIGVILAFIVMAIFNSCNIVITNSIAKMILGGGLLHFTPTAGIIINTMIIALLGSLLSNVYPVKSALRITPLKALSKGSV